MRKEQELQNANSCMARALPHEMTFVLLARDPVAGTVIRAWVKERLLLGLNKPDDGQIQQALATAEIMDDENAAIRQELGHPVGTSWKVGT